MKHQLDLLRRYERTSYRKDNCYLTSRAAVKYILRALEGMGLGELGDWEKDIGKGPVNIVIHSGIATE